MKGSDRGVKVVLATSYGLILIATALLTSQCIHNYPIVAFIWTFIGLTLDGTPLSAGRDSASDDADGTELHVS